MRIQTFWQSIACLASNFIANVVPENVLVDKIQEFNKFNKPILIEEENAFTLEKQCRRGGYIKLDSSNIQEVKTKWYYDADTNNTKRFPSRIEMNIEIENQTLNFDMDKIQCFKQDPMCYYEFTSRVGYAIVTMNNNQELYYLTDFYHVIDGHEKHFKLMPIQQIGTYYDYVLINIDDAPHAIRQPLAEQDAFRVMELNTIKIVTLTDHLIYNKFLLMEDTSLASSHTLSNVLDKIELITDKILERISKTYEDIDIEDVRITTETVQKIITHKPEELAFIKKAQLNDDSIDGNIALEELAKWMSTKTDIAIHDVVVVFTGFKILSKGEYVDGITVHDSICTASAHAIVTFEHFFAACKTTSKEIAKMFGIPPDGSNNECKAEDHFIMGIADYSDNNTLRFSNCSVNYWNKAFRNIDLSKKFDCLYGSSNGFPAVPDLTNVHLGQIFDLGDQCQLIFGTKSYFCGDKQDQILCQSITCYVGEACKTYPMYRSFDGTRCVKGPWCQKGVCIFDRSKPPQDVEFT